MLTRDLANKIGLFFILTDNFLKIEFPSIDFRAQYIFYLVFIVYYILVRRTIAIRSNYIVYFLLILVSLSIAPLLNIEGLLLYIKQVTLISFSLFFAYLLLNAYDFNYVAIFKDYIDLIFFAAIIALIQGVSLLLNFYHGADYSYLGFSMGNFGLGYTRVQSWFEEPSAMALAFLPVVFICVARFFRLTDMISTKKAIFIVAMFILTQSSTGLIGFLLTILIVVMAKFPFFRKLHLVVVGVSLLLSIGLALYSVPLVKLRVDDTLTLFLKSNVSGEDINKTNFSTYATYSNYKVAMKSLEEHPILGTGLGVHERNYDAYINAVVPTNRFGTVSQLNKKDAASLGIRIASELGLSGLIFTVWFLLSNRIRLNLEGQTREQIQYWVISNSILVLIFSRLMRQGHYTMLGFMLFILIYYLVKKEFYKVSNSTDLRSP